jgi:hypothetical protein
MDESISTSRALKDKDENNLHPETRTWAAQLPSSLELQSLMQQFPRIANRLASLWDTPLQCEAYLDELLFNDRSGLRQGFPPSVCREIMQLKSFLVDVGKEHKRADQAQLYDVWGKV